MFRVEVEITGIAAGGAGVGRLPDGRVTFVHRTAPGERVAVEVVEERKRWTRARLREVLEPSASRRPAPCPHYDRCGGCTLEHLDYSAQLEAKRGLVREALRRIGGIQVEVPPVVASPEEFRYRTRVTFTLRREPGGVVAGFHELENPDRVLDIGGDCLLPEAPVAAVWSRLRAEWGDQASRLPSGAELRLTLRGVAGGQVTLLVDGGYGPGRPQALLERVEGLESVWHRPAGAGDYRVLAGPPSLPERWEADEVELSGDVFTQVNRGAAELLTAHVLGLLEGASGRVLDAYCGVGLYARALEREGVPVVGIEAHPSAVEEARRAAPGSRILEGRVEDRLAEALPVDAAVLNPPRAGVHERVTDLLRADPPPRVIYVSCDPATLARDLGRLAPVYAVRGLRCFDLFPQTAHVETVVELAARGRAEQGKAD